MQVELLTLKGSKFTGEAAQVSLATTEGDLGILPHHETLTAVAAGGPVSIRLTSGETHVFAIFGGLLEVRDNKVRLLADEAEHAQDLVLEQVEAALKKAVALKAAAKGKEALAVAQLQVDRQQVRLEVARMRRQKGGSGL